MAVALRTVKDIIDDAYMAWRGALTIDAGTEERTAIRRALQRHARDAWRKYEWFFALAKVDDVDVDDDGNVLIPSDCESILEVRDSQSGALLQYTQRGTTQITLTAVDSSSVNLEYRTDEPTFVDAETTPVNTQLDTFLVECGIAEGWGLDRQITKRSMWIRDAWDHLKLSMEVITRQRNLKRRPVMRNYRMGI